MAFQIAEGFFDLHPLGVQLLDSALTASLVG